MVSLGSRFGLTSNTLNAKFFLVRPFKYYDVNKNIVNISMVQSIYRPDVDNIAVFEQFIVNDPTKVEQSKFRIVNINDELSTSGLATCTGLAMIIGTKKFMAHLDALTHIEPIIHAIKIEINKENIDAELLNPTIYPGDLNSNFTLQKAKEICLSVGIPEINYQILEISMFDKVII